MTRATLIENLARKLKLDPSGETASKFLYREGEEYSAVEKDEIWKLAEEEAYPSSDNWKA